MAKSSVKDKEVVRLIAQNRLLKKENEALKKKLNSKKSSQAPSSGWLKTFGVAFFASIAIFVLVVGNIIFWAGNTVVKTNRYVETVAPLVKDPAIQDAVAHYTTEQLFKNVDVEGFTEEVLPPRASFLAPALDTQLRNYTEKTLKTVLQNEKFQQVWVDVHRQAHAAIIDAASKHGQDGIIDINELYSELSGELKDTKLSFLADKQLPDRVGQYKIFESDELAVLSKVINNIDLWRTLAIILLAASLFMALWLGRFCRRTAIILGITLLGGLFISLLGLRIARESLLAGADPQYVEALRQAWKIVFDSFVVQTVVIMSVIALAICTVWISGSSRSAKVVKNRIDAIFAGKLHSAIFGNSENGLSLWLGAHKRAVQWVSVSAVAIAALFIKLTPKAVVICALIALALVLVTEVLAAPQAKAVRRGRSRK